MTTLATNVQDQSVQPVTVLTGLGNGRNINFTRGKKFFELTNHLGNVLARVSDKKIGVSANSSTIDSYNPVITSAQEYYPFGMLMPGRGGHIGTGRNVLGSTVVMNGDTVPSTLTVSQRAASLPATYTATEMISFEDGFVSAEGDQFKTMFVDQTSTDPGTESGVSYGIDAKGYRYGFNGKERSDEVRGEGNSYAAMFWEYDSRIGRRGNLDPRPISGMSSYLTFNNNPILYSDVKGDTIGLLFSNGFIPTYSNYQQGKLVVPGTGNKKLANFTNDTWFIAAATLVYLRALQNSPDPEIRRRFEVLNGSPNYHIISVRTTRILRARRWWWWDDYQTVTGNFVPSPLIEDSYKMRLGTNIAFDPNDWYLSKKDPNRHPIIGLTHELLGHAYDQDQGTKLPNNKLSHYSLSLNEVFAIDIENHMRAMLRVKERIDYNDVAIDDDERYTVIPHPITFPPLMKIQSLPTPAILNKYIKNE